MVESCELVSLRELSRRTGLSEPHLRKLRDEAGMPVYRIGLRTQSVIWSEFVAWVRSHRVESQRNATQ